MKTLRLLLLLALIPFASCISEDSGKKKTRNYVVEGDVMPAFEIENSISGGWNGLKSPNDFLGKKTLFMFFVSTCPDCQRELPYVEYAWTKLSEGGLNVVPVSRAETHNAVREYWETAGFLMPAYFDDDRTVFDLFANQTVPRIYLVDAEARVVWMRVENLGYGTFTEKKGDEFNKLIESIFKAD